MALKTKTIAVGVVDILNVDAGLTSTPKQVFDGNGVGSSLYLSTGKIGIGQASPTTQNAANTFLHIGDSSTGISSILLEDNANTWEIINNDNLYINDGGTTRLTMLAANGYFGINTTSPDSQLDVEGQYPAIRVTSDATGHNNFASFGFDSGGGGPLIINQQANSKIVFTTNSGDIRMAIDGGNVGIGETTWSSPLTKLHIVSDATNTAQPTGIAAATDLHTGLFLNNSGGAVDEKYGIQFGSTSNYGHSGIYGVADDVSNKTTGDITFDFRASASASLLTERMRITHEGKVGIGTIVPEALLDVRGNICFSSANQAIVDGTALGAIQWFADDDGTGEGLEKKCEILFEGDGGWGPGDADSLLLFKIAASADVLPTTAMAIDQDGNIGIGTSAPEKMLELSDITDDAHLGFFRADSEIVDGDPLGTITFAGGQADATTRAPGASIKAEAATGWSGTLNDQPTELHFYTQSDGSDNSLSTPRMIIDMAGNVGIGEESPAADLEIKGNLSLALSSANSVVTDGATGTNRYVASTAHGLAVGDSVRLKDTSAATYSIFTVATVTDANSFIIDSDGDAAEDKGQAYKDSDLFGIRNGDDVGQLVVDNSGSVGIRTASPVSALEVVTESANSDLTITTYDDSATINSVLTLRTADGTKASAGTVEAADVLGVIRFNGYDNNSFEEGAQIKVLADETWTASARGTHMSFWTIDNTTTGLDERMRIDHNGNVGIGEANPSHPFHLKASKDDHVAKIENTSSDATGDGLIIKLGHATPTTGDFITFLDSGDVAHGEIIGNGASAVSYNTTSDYRLKEDIVDMPSVLNMINELKPRTFKMKAGSSTEYGFIAHELQEVLPMTVSGVKDGMYDVSEDDERYGKEKLQSIDKPYLVPILVKAVQELTAKVEALENA